MSLPVGQEYRDLLKLIPGVQYTPGQRARPERRRQRPGQRLQLRRRERHAAALRHALGRALVARHRAGDDDQGRRQGRGLRPLRRVFDRHDQQVGHEPICRRSQLSVPDRQHGGRAARAAARRATSRIAPGSSRASAVRSCRTSCSSTGRTTAPRTRARTAPTSTASCRPTSGSRNEGFGKVTFTPVSSVLLNFSYRDSRARWTRATLFASNASATTGTGTEAEAEDRHRGRLVGHQLAQPADLQVQPLRRSSRWAGRTTVANVNISTRRRHQARHDSLDTQGLLTVPTLDHRPDGVQRLRAAAHRSLRLRRATASRVGGGTVGYGAQFDDARVLQRRGPDRLQHHVRRRGLARPARRLSAVCRCREPASGARTAGV